MDSIPSDGKDLLQCLKRHPAYEHLNDPDFFVDYPIMHSPLALPGMARAVEYLDTALSQDQQILLVGDRDVDGVSSTALLQRFLLLRKRQSRPGPQNGPGNPESVQAPADQTESSPGKALELVRTLVSDEGDDYGLAGHFLTRILESTASLIVLMDMGSAHLSEIQSILDTGKKVIVLDHHVISDPTAIPDCGFINPRLLPYLESLEHEGKIATVGLVFKLLAAYALFHTGLWNRIEVLLQTDGNYHLYRNGAFLYSSGASLDQPSIIPSELQNYFPAALTDPSTAALSIQEALAQAAANGGEDRMMENGLFTIANPEIQIIQESDLVGEDRKQSAPWLESMEGRLRAGQYLFSASVMQRPRLLEFLVEHSDLAAIGLVTDMVPLRGENRTVARLGMRLNSLLGTVIPEPQFRPGLSSLYSALRIDRTNWSGRDFGWKIGPVLNAAGRMGETHLALALLCSGEQEEADTLARKLVRLNERRKDRTRKN
ncbi:MAG: DHH family phosphoesterase, partial [Leptospiraceae bacterium]|nr:DHH family phosphoesterase [Leptospiraceae bacterium]